MYPTHTFMVAESVQQNTEGDYNVRAPLFCRQAPEQQNVPIYGTLSPIDFQPGIRLCVSMQPTDSQHHNITDYNVAG